MLTGRLAGASEGSMGQFQGHDPSDDEEHAQVPHQRGWVPEEEHAHQKGPGGPDAGPDGIGGADGDLEDTLKEYEEPGKNIRRLHKNETNFG